MYHDYTGLLVQSNSKRSQIQESSGYDDPTLYSDPRTGNIQDRSSNVRDLSGQPARFSNDPFYNASQILVDRTSDLRYLEATKLDPSRFSDLQIWDEIANARFSNDPTLTANWNPRQSDATLERDMPNESTLAVARQPSRGSKKRGRFPVISTLPTALEATISSVEPTFFTIRNKRHIEILTAAKQSLRASKKVGRFPVIPSLPAASPPIAIPPRPAGMQERTPPATPADKPDIVPDTDALEIDIIDSKLSKYCFPALSIPSPEGFVSTMNRGLVTTPTSLPASTEQRNDLAELDGKEPRGTPFSTGVKAEVIKRHLELVDRGKKQSEEISPSRGRRADDGLPPRLFVRALFDYAADDNACLSFCAGDLIQVYTQLESGWWDGVIHGVRGWFPSSYTTVNIFKDEDEEAEDGKEEGEQDENEDDEDEDEDDEATATEVKPEFDLRPRRTDLGNQDPAAFWIPQIDVIDGLSYFNVLTGQKTLKLLDGQRLLNPPSS